MGALPQIIFGCTVYKPAQQMLEQLFIWSSQNQFFWPAVAIARYKCTATSKVLSSSHCAQLCFYIKYTRVGEL